MTVLLIKDGEIVPLTHLQRRMRMSHIASVFLDAGYRVDWLTSNFDHASKTHRDCSRRRSITGITLWQLRNIGYEKNNGIRRLLQNEFLDCKLPFFYYFMDIAIKLSLSHSLL